MSVKHAMNGIILQFASDTHLLEPDTPTMLKLQPTSMRPNHVEEKTISSIQIKKTRSSYREMFKTRINKHVERLTRQEDITLLQVDGVEEDQ